MKTTFRGHDDWDNPDDDADPRGMPRPGAYPIRPAKNKQEYRGSRKDPNQLTFTQSDDSDPTPPYGYYRP